MCAAAGWFSRYVTCCVSGSSSSAVGREDDDVARLSRKDCRRRCSSARQQRRRHDGLDGTFSCSSRCRRRSENEPVRDHREELLGNRKKTVKSDVENDDDENQLRVFTAAICQDEISNGKLVTNLEYVCCCERCDSVTGWYLTTHPTSVTSEQSQCKLAPSLRLQNYLLACEKDRSRSLYDGCRGPLKSDDRCSARDGNVMDVEMSVSLISSCDIKGVDLLAGHQLRKDVSVVDRQYNEIVGCFRPPPNRTIGHIYLAAAAAATAADEHFEQIKCHHPAKASQCCSSCQNSSDAEDEIPPPTFCCVLRRSLRRRRRSTRTMSAEKRDVGRVNER